jgi:hypothetical protein
MEERTMEEKIALLAREGNHGGDGTRGNKNKTLCTVVATHLLRN